MAVLRLEAKPGPTTVPIVAPSPVPRAKIRVTDLQPVLLSTSSVPVVALVVLLFVLVVLEIPVPEEDDAAGTVAASDEAIKVPSPAT